MLRPSLSHFRSQWPEEAMGICRGDPKVVTYCNDAQQRLMIDPLAPDEGWWGSWATMTLTATKTCNYAYVTTPQEVARIIVMDVCRHPVHIRNGFYEYLSFGAGLKPNACSGGCRQEFSAYERDNVVTLSDFLTTAQTIRFYPEDSRDSGLRVLVQGLDANGKTILTTDPNTGLSAPGEYISLSFPFTDSVNTFTKITGIMKDQTYGPIQIFQVDPTTLVETALSGMEPNEQTASYRRYLVNGIPNFDCNCDQPGLVQMTCQVRLEFQPVQNETDYLSIPNVAAVVEEAMSIKYSHMDSGNAFNKSQIHHLRAIALLNGELDQKLGKTSTSVKVPIWGSNRLRRQPV